jgi:hypothetical protein
MGKELFFLKNSGRKVYYSLIVTIMLLSLLAGACKNPTTRQKASDTTLPVKIEPMLISQLGNEHFGNAIYRRGKNGPGIAASGKRILEWPVEADAPVREVVAPGPDDFNNGACALDVNGDNIDEMIVARTVNKSGTDLLWFGEVSGQQQWKEHLIGFVSNNGGEEGIHDIMPLETIVHGKSVRGVAIVVNRKRLLWFQIPDDVTQPWIQHSIADLGEYGAEAPQSGMVLGDITGNGLPDLVCGNFRAECPANPSTDTWQIHRYSNWDKRSTPVFSEVPAWVKDQPFGGMNQLDLGDIDGDGKLDIVATDAEIPDARIGVFCRNPEDLSGMWKETIIDTGLYCPHSLVVTDVNKDNHPDIIAGEMTAGGWWFPRTTAPKLYLYLNQGNLKFRKYILYEGWGIHMMRLAKLQPHDRLFLFAADEIQSWYKDMNTHVVGWIINPIE